MKSRVDKSFHDRYSSILVEEKIETPWYRMRSQANRKRIETDRAEESGEPRQVKNEREKKKKKRTKEIAKNHSEKQKKKK